MPELANASASVVEMSASAVGMSLSATSTMTTSEPKARSTVANCTPVDPDPMITTRPGSSLRCRTCSPSTARSAPGIDRRRECPPTAMTADSNSMVRAPSGPSTCSWWSPTKLARPLMNSTPASENRLGSALARWTSSTTSSMRCLTVSQWTVTGPSSTPNVAAARASRASRAVRASTRTGVQPVLVHTPPTRSASTMVTDAPSAAARSAAAVPAGPAPMTTRSLARRLSSSFMSSTVPRSRHYDARSATVKREGSCARPPRALPDGRRPPGWLPHSTCWSRTPLRVRTGDRPNRRSRPDRSVRRPSSAARDRR